MLCRLTGVSYRFVSYTMCRARFTQWHFWNEPRGQLFGGPAARNERSLLEAHRFFPEKLDLSEIRAKRPIIQGPR